MTRWLQQYVDLTRMTIQMFRAEIWFFLMLQFALSVSLMLGLGYLVPDLTDSAALFLMTGAATQSIVTVGLVGLPQSIAQAKAEGRLEFFFTLPISREAYLLAQVTFVALLALPGTAFAVLFGAWYYDVALHVDLWLLVVVPLAMLSLAGVGVAMAMLSPQQQLTNALTQLIIFYVLFFAPILLPREQLPWLLQKVAWALPPTYAADAIRATVTNLPGTELARSMVMLAVFAAGSLAIGSATMRRRA